jgi:hypothetical protein
MITRESAVQSYNSGLWQKAGKQILLFENHKS